MASHHDNHHSEEKKPVSFSTPMILGLVTLLAIVLLVSTCDKKHGCCEEEAKCEQADAHHGAGHDAHAVKTEAHQEATATTEEEVDGLEIVDTEEELVVPDSIH